MKKENKNKRTGITILSAEPVTEESLKKAFKEKEFNLSEKIHGKKDTFIHTRSIKEFIKKENELIQLFIEQKISWDKFILRRANLIGEKLI